MSHHLRATLQLSVGSQISNATVVTDTIDTRDGHKIISVLEVSPFLHLVKFDFHRSFIFGVIFSSLNHLMAK